MAEQSGRYGASSPSDSGGSSNEIEARRKRIDRNLEVAIRNVEIATWVLWIACGLQVVRLIYVIKSVLRHG